MASSFHDANGVHTLLAVGSDGSTLRNVYADPTTHALQTVGGSTGTDNGPTTSRHDNNNIPILVATSNADGKTPIVVYADSNGNLLLEAV